MVSEVSNNFTSTVTPDMQFDQLWTTSRNRILKLTLCIWHICNNNICNRMCWQERSEFVIFSPPTLCRKWDVRIFLWLHAHISFLRRLKMFTNNWLSLFWLSLILTSPPLSDLLNVGLAVESQHGGQRGTDTVQPTSTSGWYRRLCSLKVSLFSLSQ